jgi:hypothetical protein
METYARAALAVLAGSALWLTACALGGCKGKHTPDPKIPPPVASPYPPNAQPGTSGAMTGEGPAGGMSPSGPAGGPTGR